MAPPPDFLLLMERTTSERPQMTSLPAPSAPYGGTGSVPAFWRLDLHRLVTYHHVPE